MTEKTREAFEAWFSTQFGFGPNGLYQIKGKYAHAPAALYRAFTASPPSCSLY